MYTHGNTVRSRKSSLKSSSKCGEARDQSKSKEILSKKSNSSTHRINELENILRQLQHTQDQSLLRNRSLLADFDSTKQKVWTLKDNENRLDKVKERFNKNVKKAYSSETSNYGILQESTSNPEKQFKSNETKNDIRGTNETQKIYHAKKRDLNDSQHDVHQKKFNNTDSSSEYIQNLSIPSSQSSIPLDPNRNQLVSSKLGNLTVLPQVLAVSPDGQLVLLPMSYTFPLHNSMSNNENTTFNESLVDADQNANSSTPTNTTLKDGAYVHNHRQQHNFHKHSLNKQSNNLTLNQLKDMSPLTETIHNDHSTMPYHKKGTDNDTMDNGYRRKASPKSHNENQPIASINNTNGSYHTNSKSYSNHLGDSVSFDETDNESEQYDLDYKVEETHNASNSFLQLEDLNDMLPRTDLPSPTVPVKHFNIMQEPHEVINSIDNKSTVQDTNNIVSTNSNVQLLELHSAESGSIVSTSQKRTNKKNPTSSVQLTKSLSVLDISSVSGIDQLSHDKLNSSSHSLNSMAMKKTRKSPGIQNQPDRRVSENPQQVEEHDMSQFPIKAVISTQKTQDRFTPEDDSDVDLFSDESLPLSESFGSARKTTQSEAEGIGNMEEDNMTSENQITTLQSSVKLNFELISSLFHLLEKQIEDEYVNCQELYVKSNGNSSVEDFLRLGIDNILNLKGSDLFNAILNLVKNKVQEICPKDAIQPQLINVKDIDLITIRNHTHPDIHNLLDMILDHLSFIDHYDSESISMIAEPLLQCLTDSENLIKLLVSVIVDSLQMDSVADPVSSPSPYQPSVPINPDYDNKHSYNVKTDVISQPVRKLSIDLGSISSDESSLSSFDSEKMNGNSAKQSALVSVEETPAVTQTQENTQQSSQWKPIIDSHSVDFNDNSDDDIEDLLGSGLGTNQIINNDKIVVHATEMSFKQPTTSDNVSHIQQTTSLNRKKSQEIITRSSSIQSPSPPPSHTNSIKSKVLKRGFWEDSDDDDDGPGLISKTTNSNNGNDEDKLDNEDDFDFEFYQ